MAALGKVGSKTGLGKERDALDSQCYGLHFLLSISRLRTVHSPDSKYLGQSRIASQRGISLVRGTTGNQRDSKRTWTSWPSLLYFWSAL